jgi:hypothetical protein
MGVTTPVTRQIWVSVSQPEDAHDTFVAQNVPAADHQSSVGHGSSEYLTNEHETAGQEDRYRATHCELCCSVDMQVLAVWRRDIEPISGHRQPRRGGIGFNAHGTLEKPPRSLFRKDGQQHEELTHALGQITDWRRYLEDNLRGVQKEPGLEVDPPIPGEPLQRGSSQPMCP